MSLLSITPENFAPWQKDAYCSLTLLDRNFCSLQRTISVKYMWGSDKPG